MASTANTCQEDILQEKAAQNNPYTKVSRPQRLHSVFLNRDAVTHTANTHREVRKKIKKRETFLLS